MALAVTGTARSKQLYVLRQVLNRAGRVIYGLTKFDHIAPLMNTFKWGLITELVRKKYTNITAATISGQTSAYLSILLIRATHGKTRKVFYAAERPNCCAARKMS